MADQRHLLATDQEQRREGTTNARARQKHTESTWCRHGCGWLAGPADTPGVLELAPCLPKLSDVEFVFMDENCCCSLKTVRTWRRDGSPNGRQETSHI